MEGTIRTRRNSITPSRAFLTTGVSVLIFIPGPAGMAHEAWGLGDFSISTRHTASCKDKSAPGTQRGRL